MLDTPPGLVPETEAAGHGERFPGEARPAKGAPDWRRSKWWPIVACGVGYVVLSLIAVGHVGDLGSAHVAGPGGADQTIQIWWIAWAEHALAHGQNPFFSNWINYPVGMNAGPNGSMLLLGTIMSPLTAVFGPAVSWNVLVRLSLCVSAFAMCLCLRRWTRWWPAAFVGGLLYGFCTYQTLLAGGYVFLTFVPFPPIVFLLLYEGLARQQWKPARAGVLLALVCTAQFFVSSEVFASTVLFGCAAVVLYLLAERRSFASRWPYTRTFGIWAILVGAALLALPVAWTLLGPQAAHGAPNATVKLFHGDLLGGIVPTRFQRFTSSGLASFSTQHFGPSSDLYVGFPFVLAIGGIVVWLRKRGIVVLAGGMAALSFTLSLGSTLFIGGDDTHVPLPYVVLAHLPLTQGLDPLRLSLFTCLFGGAVVAFGLDEAHRRWRGGRMPAGVALSARQRMVGLVVLVVTAGIIVLPTLPRGTEAVAPSRVAPFFSSRAAARIPRGSVVLAYPYPNAPVFPDAFGYSYSQRYQAINDPLLDQAAAGLPFRLIGSYGWRPNESTGNTAGPSPLAPASVEAFFDYEFYGVTTSSGQSHLLLSRNLVSDFRDFLRQHHVGTVVVLPKGQHPARVSALVTSAIGAPSREGGTTVWFDVERRLETVVPSPAPALVVAPPVTRVVKPTSDEKLEGRRYLLATASGDLGLRKVVFDITGMGRSFQEAATHIAYGWLGGWNTATVANGTYTVRSEASDDSGQIGMSAGVVVHVQNPGGARPSSGRRRPQRHQSARLSRRGRSCSDRVSDRPTMQSQRAWLSRSAVPGGCSG
jgi:hypothetical protein